MSASFQMPASLQITVLSNDALEKAKIKIKSFLSRVGGDVFDGFAVFCDPPSESKEIIHASASSNLTELELAKKVYYAIHDEELRDRLVKQVMPFFKGSGATDQDFLKAFHLTSLDELDDKKEDVSVNETTQSVHGDRFDRHVYNCRAFLKRQNGMYTLLLAYYSMEMTLSKWSLRALLQCDEDKTLELQALLALGTHRLHSRLASEAPGLITTRVVDNPSLLTM